MSLAIDIDNVKRVLIKQHGWVEVSRCSFDLDAYEFMDGTHSISGGFGTGFSFKDADGRHYMGPISSILAIEYEQ